ncbi:MAG: hypothetical protein ACXW2Y_04345 [Acidimicrobiia bacterium]
MPNLIPDWFPWLQPLGRMLWALLFTVIGLGIVLVLMRRPKPDRPATWAECMAGAVGVFALFFLCYAIIPHEWLTFADGYLNWSTDKFVFTSNQWAGGLPPFDLPYSALKDAVAAGIYIVFFGLNLFLFSKWQKRPTVSEAAAEGTEQVVRTSRFGRPVKAKA